jgi:hypothetical protein
MTDRANDTDKPSFTHIAWIEKTEFIRKGRRHGRWIEEGVARLEPDGSMHVYLHSLPIGGWDGRVYLGRIGAGPPEPIPRRPSDDVNEMGD